MQVVPPRTETENDPLMTMRRRTGPRIATRPVAQRRASEASFFRGPGGVGYRRVWARRARPVWGYRWVRLAGVRWSGYRVRSVHDWCHFDAKHGVLMAVRLAGLEPFDELCGALRFGYRPVRDGGLECGDQLFRVGDVAVVFAAGVQVYASAVCDDEVAVSFPAGEATVLVTGVRQLRLRSGAC